MRAAEPTLTIGPRLFAFVACAAGAPAANIATGRRADVLEIEAAKVAHPLGHDGWLPAGCGCFRFRVYGGSATARQAHKSQVGLA